MCGTVCARWCSSWTTRPSTASSRCWSTPATTRSTPPSDGADFYNELHPWRYEKLAEVFGSTKHPMHGFAVRRHDELTTLLQRIADPSDAANQGPIVVRVQLNRHDYPEALKYKVTENCPPPAGAGSEGSRR